MNCLASAWNGKRTRNKKRKLLCHELTSMLLKLFILQTCLQKKAVILSSERTAEANEQGGHLTTRNRAENTAFIFDHRLQYKRSHIQ